jgi:hypothetical protein
MKKLLKFNEFSLLMESLLLEAIEWEQILADSYETMFPENKGKWTFYKGSGVVPGEKECFFRAPFSADTPKENIEKFLTLNKVMFKNLEEVSKEESITDKYQAFRFTVDQETPIGTRKKLVPGIQYFVVNLEKSLSGNTVIGSRKSFTPADLQFNDKEFFLDSNELKETLVNRLLDKNTDKKIVDLVSAIGKAIVEFKTKKESLGDFLTEVNEMGSITFDIPFENPNKENISPENLSIIKNNIGEIFGGILMLNKLKDLTLGVNFPIASNEQVIDFSVDKLGFSSKAGKMGGGAKAAATGFCVKVKTAVDTIGWQPEPGKEQKFYDNFIIPIRDHREVGMRCKSRIFGSNIYMMTTGFPNSSPLWDLFLSLSKISIDGMEQESFISAFDLIKKEGKLHEIISHIKSITRSSPKDKTVKLFLTKDTKREEGLAAKIYDQMDNDQKIGIILYYCSVEFSKYINDNCSDELNSLLNKTLRNQQVYMDLDMKRDSVTFHIKSMQTGNFVCGPLNGIDWQTKQLTLSLSK